jgi:hypothetical protein
MKTIPPEENALKKKLQALFEVKSHSGAPYAAGEVPIF